MVSAIDLAVDELALGILAKVLLRLSVLVVGDEVVQAVDALK